VIESDIATFLMNNATVSAIVEDRVYPNQTPRDVEYPCVTYFRVSSSPIGDMGGASGMVHARIQINSWAKGNGAYIAAHGLADAIRDKIDHFRGTLSGGLHTIDAVHLVDEGDVKDKRLGVDDTVPYGVRQDYDVHYRWTVDDNTV
jgi:hypothetical protein